MSMRPCLYVLFGVPRTFGSVEEQAAFNTGFHDFGLLRLAEDNELPPSLARTLHHIPCPFPTSSPHMRLWCYIMMNIQNSKEALIQLFPGTKGVGRHLVEETNSQMDSNASLTLDKIEVNYLRHNIMPLDEGPERFNTALSEWVVYEPTLRLALVGNDLLNPSLWQQVDIFRPHSLLCKGRKIIISVAFFHFLPNYHFISPFSF